jgi:hypothetical protein
MMSQHNSRWDWYWASCMPELGQHECHDSTAAGAHAAWDQVECFGALT